MDNAEKDKLFRELFEENKDKIFRLCSGYLTDKEEINDLFQEIMIHIWRNLDSFRGEAKISTWIYRIAVNTSLLYTKRLKKYTGHLSDKHLVSLSDESFEDHERNTEFNDRLKKLHAAIAGLPKQDRLLISLQLEGITYKEIAEITGITENYVGVKLNRIKQVLEKRLKAKQNG